MQSDSRVYMALSRCLQCRTSRTPKRPRRTCWIQLRPRTCSRRAWRTTASSSRSISRRLCLLHDLSRDRKKKVKSRHRATSTEVVTIDTFVLVWRSVKAISEGYGAHRSATSCQRLITIRSGTSPRNPAFWRCPMSIGGICDAPAIAGRACFPRVRVSDHQHDGLA